MRRWLGALVVGIGVIALSGAAGPVASAGENGQFYVGKWEPSETEPSIVRAGIQVSDGVVDRWFVTYRDECRFKGQRPTLSEHNAHAMHEKDLEIGPGGRFAYRFANKWSNAATRSIFRGRIDGDEVTGIYRSRFRYRSDGKIEKCHSGPLRFEFERGTAHAFFDGFDPFGK